MEINRLSLEMMDITIFTFSIGTKSSMYFLQKSSLISERELVIYK